jgi:hypothetical protein
MIAPAPARGVAAAHLLDLWEAGGGRFPAERALLLLRAAAPDLDDGALGDLPVGERDRRLLLLRERWFGPTIAAVAACPACGQLLELNFAVTDILLDAAAPTDDVHVAARDGYEITFRLPTSRQAALAATSGDLDAARASLLAGCLVAASRHGEPIPPGDLPPEVIDHIARAMQEADPQAQVELGLRCVACDRAWSVFFDIAVYFWEEIAARARQLMREVHQLAAAYGWHERDILGMSPARRARYLELASGD